MAKHNWYREQLLSNYNKLYKRNYKLDQSKCRYCNDPFYCYDHRPAISQCPNMNIKYYVTHGGKFELLPCCKECNSYLGDKYFIDALDCLFYLMDRYREKIHGIPIWTESELHGMRHSLKGNIILRQLQRNATVDKIENIRLNITNYNDK